MDGNTRIAQLYIYRRLHPHYSSPHIKDRDKPEKKELEYAWLCVCVVSCIFKFPSQSLAVSIIVVSRQFPKEPKEDPSSNAITLKKSPFSCLVPFFFLPGKPIVDDRLVF